MVPDVGFDAEKDRGTVGCSSGINNLTSAAVFINGGCCASGCEGWRSGVNGEGKSSRAGGYIASGIGGNRCDRGAAI